jgi:hypothetical protein
MDNLSDEKKMLVRSLSSFVEIVGGQPLDRIKINSQLPIDQRLKVSKLIKMGPKELYSASFISIFQRCFLYIPSIYFINDYYDKIKFTKDYDYVMRPLFVSLFITPQVSIFESLKTNQQLEKNKTIIDRLKFKYQTNGINGVFPSLLSTYLRETAFIGGICVLTPKFLTLLKNHNDCSGVNSIVAGGTAGAITQFISHPFDSIKTLQEVNNSSFKTTFQTIYQTRGISGFYSGVIPRTLRGIWTLGCLSYCNSFFSEKLFV